MTEVADVTVQTTYPSNKKRLVKIRRPVDVVKQTLASLTPPTSPVQPTEPDQLAQRQASSSKPVKIKRPTHTSKPEALPPLPIESSTTVILKEDTVSETVQPTKKSKTHKSRNKKSVSIFHVIAFRFLLTYRLENSNGSHWRKCILHRLRQSRG